MDCSWLCVSVLGLFIVYKLLDRILRIPYIGRYADRCIFVTGCDTGFGHELAKRLDSLGCHVFAGCLTEKGETDLKKTCSDRVHPIPLDISKPDSVRKAFKIITDKLDADEKDLWAVVNNAGIIDSRGPMEWLKIGSYKAECDVNLFGTIDVTMTFLPLIKRSRGRVVIMSSSLARMSLTFVAPYVVSKCGLEGFGDSLRKTLRPYGCPVSIIEPGFFLTKISTRAAFQAAFERSWSQVTSPEIRDEFGDEYCKSLCSGLLAIFEAKGADDFSPVIDDYIHAILVRYPRARYQPGIDGKLLVMLASLPESIGDWLLEKLGPRMPTPAMLKRQQ